MRRALTVLHYEILEYVSIRFAGTVPVLPNFGILVCCFRKRSQGDDIAMRGVSREIRSCLVPPQSSQQPVIAASAG